QAAAIVEKVTYLGWELKVIEVDGVADAVQIRSKKSAEDGFVEVILRHGNHLSLERKAAPLHISKGDFERLIRDLQELFDPLDASRRRSRAISRPYPRFSTQYRVPSCPGYCPHSRRR